MLASVCAVDMLPHYLFAVSSIDRDFYMGPERAKEWGLIDEIIQTRPLESPTKAN